MIITIDLMFCKETGCMAENVELGKYKVERSVRQKRVGPGRGENVLLECFVFLIALLGFGCVSLL